MHPLEALEIYWNYTEFRPHQEEIINSVLNKKDTFALLPTGGGKSICFQIPALIMPGICIVVSPLIALIKDQVNQLKKRGIKAIGLTSGLSYNDLDKLLDNCIYGNYKFLYLSPERLQQQIVIDRIQQMKVNLIAVDEAHCISQWGHDFRPAYLNISDLRRLHPNVNCIALTASAKPKAINDIIENLDFIDFSIIKGSFKRKNIAYKVINTDDKLYTLNQILKHQKDAIIIYVRNRRSCIEISEYLKQKQCNVTFFHGGISNTEKNERLEQWSLGKIQIIVATTAFGMGIDKDNVRLVVHFNLPESIESYYQEAGRAGRDLKPAKAIIITQNNDKEALKNQFLKSLPSKQYITFTYIKLCNYFQIAYGEGIDTTHQFDFASFCKTYTLKPSVTYNSLQALDRNSVISLNRQFNFKTTVRFLIKSNAIFNYIENRLELNTIIKVLLRTYGGIFDFDTKINLSLVAKKCNKPEDIIIKELKILEQDNVIELYIANTDSEITFLQPREDDLTINAISKSLLTQKTLKTKQITSVIDYIENISDCRSTQILNYFEEYNSKACGICSVCESSSIKTSSENLKREILNLLKEEELSSRQLLEQLNTNKSTLIEHLKQLLEEEIITLSEENTFIYNGT